MKRVLATVIAASFGFLTVVCTNIASAQDSGRKVLRVNGAGMASDQVDKWAKRFMEANPGIAVTVIGSSAGKGFQALLSGAAEIAMMSREISADERKKANEKGLKLAEKPIGKAGVALITNPRNPLTELTLQQVKGTYTGQYINWKEVGGPDEPVRCLTRRIPESGGAVFFRNKVLNGDPFGPKTVMTETWEAIVKVCTVAQDLPIGIVPHTRNLSKVKTLAIRKDDTSTAVMPTEENIKNGKYPVTLTFAFAWDAESKEPAITKFADFCQSQGGGGQ
jgi:phosphate transport system substrate-binding protein